MNPNHIRFVTKNILISKIKLFIIDLTSDFNDFQNIFTSLILSILPLKEFSTISLTFINDLSFILSFNSSTVLVKLNLSNPFHTLVSLSKVDSILLSNISILLVNSSFK
jgi:hypothetical protein